MNNKKIVMGLSGGMDSTTLLGILLEQGYEVHCCNFIYGSKHNEFERKAAEKIVNYYMLKGFPIVWYPFDLTAAFTGFQSNLLLTGEEIPEGNYNDVNMKKTVVPGRNLIFASIMAGLAESIGAEAIALGVHSGDHAIYPDCRPDFIKHLHHAIRESSDQKVSVLAPLLHDNKTSIIKIGTTLNTPTPYELTRTCYKHQEYACGKCGSCNERIEAFANNNLIDPIVYAKYRK